MSFNPEAPYQDLPILPPKNIDLQSKEILLALVEASSSLAALEEGSKLILTVEY
ncbi:MAG: hypothetical protein QM613_00060 [Micrococcaceae bacterium]